MDAISCAHVGGLSSLSTIKAIGEKGDTICIHTAN